MNTVTKVLKRKYSDTIKKHDHSTPEDNLTNITQTRTVKKELTRKSLYEYKKGRSE